MRSMTGHGRGECAREGFKVTVEVGAVNRRQSEISVNLPRGLEMLEAPVRDAINARVARGRVTARISVHAADGQLAARAHLNVPLARAYAAELAKLARQLKISGEVTLDQILRAPGVFQSDEDLAGAEQIWPAARQALGQALAALLNMREREGAHLARDLSRRVAAMRKSAEKVRRQASRAAENYRTRLLGRIHSAGLKSIAPDDDRLLREVVLFADRADISEELTRLQSHFRQFEDSRTSPEPVGRKLDFLAQEMNREINTIGSKANDASIAREVVALKAELERFREQVQNVE